MGAEVVTFGEVMLRLSPPGHLRFAQARSFDATYGGAEANVAAALAGFGVAVEHVTRVPAGPIGDACLAFLRQHGIGVSHVLRGGDRLGIYFLETGASQRGSRVVYDRGGSAFAAIEPGIVDWRAALEGAKWFHFTGVTPAVSSGAAAACCEAVNAARAAGVVVSCDLNFRSQLWRWGRGATEVMEPLVAQSDLVVANEEDCDKVFGIRAEGADVVGGQVAAAPYRDVCDRLARRFPSVKTIAITLRGSLSASRNTWSAVLWREGEFIVGPVHDIHEIVDRVGAGDCFAAGLIYALLQGRSAEAALRFAVASSCLKHTIPGDFAVMSVEEVEKLVAGDASGRVVR